MEVGGGVNTKSTCYQIKACLLHDNETTQKTDVFSEKHNRLKETGLGGGGEGGGRDYRIYSDVQVLQSRAQRSRLNSNSTS